MKPSKLFYDSFYLISQGKLVQLIKEKLDRDDYGRGFEKLRNRKTPIYQEDIKSPYVYPDLAYNTDR